MADVERESNNSDEIQLTNTPEKDNTNRGRKKVRKINNKKRKRRSSSTYTSSGSSWRLPSSSSDEKRKSKKKRKRRKKTRRFPTQGKESDKSGKMENLQPSKRFTILNLNNQFKWVLTDDMAKYANSNFNQYVQERDSKESILTENPVPSNITEVKKLDEFMSNLLKENNQTSVCTKETTLEKIQKNIDVMGPLSKEWHDLESATTAPDDEVALTIEDLLNLVQQTVLLVGQTNNTISYHRRLSALAGAMKSSSQAKSMIKDKSMLFENPGKELLGKDFDNQITDTAKAQKQSKELLFNVVQQQGNNKSFSKHLPQSKLRCSGKTLASSEEAMIYDFSSRRGFNSYNNAQFKNPGKQNSDLQNNSITNTTRRVVISTTVGKKLFCNLKIPTVTLSGRLLHFLGSPEKLTKDKIILQIVQSK